MGTMSLLAVFAHPDDESCGPGGTLARCAAEGMDVHIIYATRGEFGGSPTPDKKPDYLLGELRASELRGACAALGVAECTILDYPDGSLHNCDQYALEAEILRAIRRVRPQVIITAGSEEERTSDHRIIAWVTTLAWMSAGARLTPHLADVLLCYHPGAPTENDVLNLDLVRVDISRYRQQKAAALRCHVTQSVCTRGALQALECAGPIYEYFIRAYSNPSVSSEVLTGLFEPLQ